VILGLLLACKGGDTDETDVPVDTDVVDTDVTDTNDTEDTDTGPDLDHITLEVRSDLTGSDLRVAAWLTQFAQDDSGDIVPVREYTSVAAPSFPAEVELVQPTGDDIAALDEVNSGAVFFWVVYADANGNELKDDDEPVLATGPEVVAWVETGTYVSQVWIGLDLDLTGSGGIDFFDAFDGFDVTTIDEHPETSITLTVTTSDSSRPDRLATVTLSEVDTQVGVPNRPLDVAWPDADVTTATFDEPPAADRLIDVDLPTQAAIEVPVGYRDVDASGDLSLEDTEVGHACHAGNPVAMIWLPQAPDLYSAVIDLAIGLRPGWNVAETPSRDAYPIVLDEAAAQELTLSDVDCTLQ
jgi:hypothetical protein